MATRKAPLKAATDTAGRWLDDAFDRFEKPISWLATAAIGYVLIRLIYAAITGY